jgi:hypothetical protein
MGVLGSQRGEGRTGLLIAVIVVGAAVVTGMKIIPVRVAAYEFRDVLREEARYGAVRNTDAAVAQRILERAEELNVPLKPENLSVRRTQHEITIVASYQQPIDLKLTTYVYRFNAKEVAPLF